MSTTCRLSKLARRGAVEVKEGRGGPALRLPVGHEAIPEADEQRLKVRGCFQRCGVLRRRVSALRLWRELALRGEGES